MNATKMNYPKISHLPDRMPEFWNQAYEWAKKFDDEKAKWRWEFIRRSELFRKQCLDCKSGKDPALDDLLFRWGLSGIPVKETKPFLLSFENDFSELVAALATGWSHRKDWKSFTRSYVAALSRHETGLTLPPGSVILTRAEGTINNSGWHFPIYWQVDVKIPNGKKYTDFLNEIYKTPPRYCFDFEWSEERIVFKFAPMESAPGWPRINNKFSAEEVDKIIKIAFKVYGERLPGVNFWESRAQLIHCPNQILALDIDSGLVNEKKSSNFARSLRAAKDKLSKLEDLSELRRKAFQTK